MFAADVVDDSGISMVRRYIRDGELFRDDNAARGAGL
jgi:hypothetical protein